MKSLLLLIPLLTLTSCGSFLVKKGITGNLNPSEEIRLEPAERGGSNKAFDPFTTTIILELGKAIVNLSANALENYGKKFEASYEATYLADSLNVPSSTTSWEFSRVLRYSDKSTAMSALTEAGIENPAQYIQVINSELCEVTAMTCTFDLIPSQTGKSLKLKNIKGKLTLPKANRLSRPLKDKNSIALIVTLREAVQSQGTTTSTITLTPFEFEEKATSIVIKDKNIDWVPTPSTGAYSLSVRALETGKGKAYSAKLAEWLKKIGGKGVEEGVKKL